MTFALGFTGTREGMTLPQRAALFGFLFERLPKAFEGLHLAVHGGAPGADTEFQRTLGKFGNLEGYPFIEVYAVGQERWEFWANSPHAPARHFIRAIHERTDYLRRDREIAAEVCSELIAAPRQATEIRRSGTWATVRYAREAGKPITIILPDGTLIREPGIAAVSDLFGARQLITSRSVKERKANLGR